MSELPSSINEGDTVVLSRSGGGSKLTLVRKGAIIKLGRIGNVHIDSLVGQRYGDVFVFNEQTKRLEPTDKHPDLDITELDNAEEEKDNRCLLDERQNQTLDQEEIKAMKEQKGVEKLIKALVNNSTSFSEKTGFSQEKYIRKKKSKYATLFKVEYVTPDNLCEIINPTFSIDTETISDNSKHVKLRVDAMALITQYANLFANSRVLLCDKTNGVLAACLLWRLGEEGRVFQLMDRAAQPNTVYARMMHIPDIKEKWRAVPASAVFWGTEITSEKEEGCEEGDTHCKVKDDVRGLTEKPSTGGGKRLRKEENLKEVLGVAVKMNLENNKNNDANCNNISNSTTKTEKEGGTVDSQWITAVGARDELLNSQADSLVIASDDEIEMTRIVKDSLQFLAYSGSLVVISSYLAPLTILYNEIFREFVCLEISETWYRHQQVLPARTHPSVNMNTAAGYLLTGIRIKNIL